MDIGLFKDIGLTNSEIKAYMALLELGPCTKGPLVRKAGIASSKVYEVLDKLIEKGMVSKVKKGNVKHFEAASTKRILDYVNEKEKKLKLQKRKIQDLMPQLEMRRSFSSKDSETKVYKSTKGATTCFENILKELKPGEEYYVMGISQFKPKFERFVVNFHKKRSGKKIKCRIIANETAKSTGEKLEKMPLTKVRYLQKEMFTPVVFIIYNDKTLISISLEEIFIEITSKNLAEGLKTYANHMWSIAR